MHGTEPFDLVLRNADPVEFKPPMQCSTRDAYLVNGTKVHSIIETVLLVFSTMVGDHVEEFLVDRNRSRVARRCGRA